MKKRSRIPTGKKSLAEIERRAKIKALKRDRVYERDRKRRKLLVTRRARVEKTERDALNARERARQLRKYVKGFDADQGFDLRAPKQLSRQQRKKIERAYKELAPLILKPHVRVRVTSKKQLRALTEFSGIHKKPRRMRAVPVITPAPEKTKVSVDKAGSVRVQVGKTVQRYYFIPKELRRLPTAEMIARRMRKKLPAGKYFILTGEHEAYTRPVLHDPNEPAGESDLLRQLQRWTAHYGLERLNAFFRGFRYITTLDNEKKVFAEQGRFRKRRKILDAAREARRHEVGTVARRRARRQVKK